MERLQDNYKELSALGTSRFACRNCTIGAEVNFRYTETKIMLRLKHCATRSVSLGGVWLNEEEVLHNASSLFLSRYGTFHESYEEKVLKFLPSMEIAQYLLKLCNSVCV